MALRNPLKLICPTAWAICLATGYVLIGQWALLALVCLAWLGWLLAAGRSPATMLVASVGVSAAGVSVGAPSFLMIIGATLALASWDLVRWDSFLAADLPAETVARLDWKHYAWLVLALMPALLAALAGRLIHFQLPSGGLVAIVLLALLGLDRIWIQTRG